MSEYPSSTEIVHKPRAGDHIRLVAADGKSGIVEGVVNHEEPLHLDGKPVPEGQWYAFRLHGRSKLASLTLQEAEAQELMAGLKVLKQELHESGSMSRKSLISRAIEQLREQGF